MEPLPVKPVPIRIRGSLDQARHLPTLRCPTNVKAGALTGAARSRVFNALTYDTFRGYAAISRRADRKPVSQPVYYEWPTVYSPRTCPDRAGHGATSITISSANCRRFTRAVSGSSSRAIT